MLNGEEVDEVDEDDEDDTPLSELVLGLLTAERACRRHWTCGTACSSGARKAPAPASLPSVATSANERGRRKSTESATHVSAACDITRSSRSRAGAGGNSKKCMHLPR